MRHEVKVWIAVDAADRSDASRQVEALVAGIPAHVEVEVKGRPLPSLDEMTTAELDAEAARTMCPDDELEDLMAQVETEWAELLASDGEPYDGGLVDPLGAPW